MSTQSRSLSHLFCLVACATLIAGCATRPKPVEDQPAVTQIDLEAPAASIPPGMGSSPGLAPEVTSLQAANDSLRSEIDRLQSANRAYAMETARLREEMLARPISGASSGYVGAATDSGATVDSAPAAASSSRSGSSGGGGGGGYTVQTASYSKSSKGRAAAEKLCSFFESKGFSPCGYRESGTYLIVTVGSFGSRDEAKEARDRIAELDYYGRKNDFKSASVRSN